MALRFTFGTTPGGSLRSASDLDQEFTDVALLGIIPCTATGTNAITLTPAVNTPVVASYQNNLSFGFVAAANSTGSVSLQVNALASLPLYLQDGVTQAASGDITIGTFYIASYVSSYNSGGGGWSLTGKQPASSPDFSSLTVTENPANSAVVAGSIGAGSANNRAFEVGEIGGWSVLLDAVAAGSANLSFDLSTFVADFEDFRAIGSYLAPATDAVDLWCLTSPDGTNFDTGASNYAYLSFESTSGGVAQQNSTGDTKIIMNSTDQLGNSTQENMSFDLILFNAGQTAAFTQLTWTFGMQSSVPRVVVGQGAGRRLAAAAVKGLRFQMSTGNIATGKVSILGRRKVT